MKSKKGDRVFVLKKADDEKIYLYGFGIHEGDDNKYCNPKLKLDSGEILFGIQCWFGREDKFEDWAGGREIVSCKIPAPFFKER